MTGPMISKLARQYSLTAEEAEAVNNVLGIRTQEALEKDRDLIAILEAQASALWAELVRLVGDDEARARVYHYSRERRWDLRAGA